LKECFTTLETKKGLTKTMEQLTSFYLVHESDGGRLEGVLLRQVHFDFPDSAFVGGPLGPEELDDELVEAAEDGDLVLALDQLDDVGVHTTLASTRR